MRTYSKIVIRGHVGAKPELRTVGGTSTTIVNIATNERWTAKDGTPQERTDWHRCVFWGKPAEQIVEYVDKGTDLMVEGRLQYRSYEDAKGVTRTAAEVRVDEYYLGSKPRAAASPRAARTPAYAGASASADDIFGDEPPF